MKPSIMDRIRKAFGYRVVDRDAAANELRSCPIDERPCEDCQCLERKESLGLLLDKSS
jgi:hypothetical protein